MRITFLFQEGLYNALFNVSTHLEYMLRFGKGRAHNSDGSQVESQEDKQRANLDMGFQSNREYEP